MRKSTPALLVLAALPLLSGCSFASTGAAAVDETTTSKPIEVERIQVLVAGDSLASGGPWDALPKDPGSWTYFLGDDLELVGGWRRDGATSGLIAANIPAERGDALVLMAGTNDVRKGIAPTEVVRSIATIVATVNVETVVLAAIPPQPEHPDEVVKLNAALLTLAGSNGWTWIDPWTPYRAEGVWSTNGSVDGVHGTRSSYRAAGEAITDAVVLAVSAAPTSSGSD